MRLGITKSRKIEKAKKKRFARPLLCSFGDRLDRFLFFFLFCLTFSFAGKTPFARPSYVSGDTPSSSSKRAEAPNTPSFRDDIRPLLETKCWRCHSGKTRRKDLDLSSEAGIFKGSESGAVIIPGKPGESLLYEKVHSGKMPPAKKDRLSRTRPRPMSFPLCCGIAPPATADIVKRRAWTSALRQRCFAGGNQAPPSFQANLTKV